MGEPVLRTIDALYTSDIDMSLDEEGAKQRFWRAFKTLGVWYDDLPPTSAQDLLSVSPVRFGA
jgi:hypothetical protein